LREAWVKSAEDMALLERIGLSDIDPNLREFHRIGEVYFHAKKHGKISAMLFKLQRA